MTTLPDASVVPATPSLPVFLPKFLLNVGFKFPNSFAVGPTFHTPHVHLYRIECPLGFLFSSLLHLAIDFAPIFVPLWFRNWEEAA